MSITRRPFSLLLALAPLLCINACGGSVDASDDRGAIDLVIATHVLGDLSNTETLSDPLRELLDRYGNDVQCELHETPPGGGEAGAGELFGTLTGAVNAEVHIMGGSLADEGGELEVSEGTEATVGDNRYRYLDQQWVDAVGVGPLSLVFPAGAKRMASKEEQAARREIESGLREMLDRYAGSGSDMDEQLGIVDFTALTLPNGAGQLVAHSIRMPPEEDYLDTMEREQLEKLEWGQEQGIVTEVLSNRRINLDGDVALRVETMMGPGYRMIAIYHWSERDPGLTTALMAIVKPNKFEGVEESLEAALDSIRLRSDG